MSQLDLNQQVAEATGESLREIRRRGFSIMRPTTDDELQIYSPPQMVDWDAADRERRRAA